MNWIWQTGVAAFKVSSALFAVDCLNLRGILTSVATSLHWLRAAALLSGSGQTGSTIFNSHTGLTVRVVCLAAKFYF